jgi:hypothetical protein
MITLQIFYMGRLWEIEYSKINWHQPLGHHPDCLGSHDPCPDGH